MSEDQFRRSLEALRDQPDALIAIIVQQVAAIAQLRAEVAALAARLRDLDDQNRGLRERVETAERTAARQAAPFRRDPLKRTVTPKCPGRRAGHRGTHRAIPAQVDAEIVVPLVTCPHCAQPVTDVRPCVQYIEELPPVRPHVTRLITHRGHCPHCATVVHSTHSLQVSTARGAAGVHLGPRALALAADLRSRAGLTMRTVCRVLHALCGLTVTPGGLAQALARIARRLRPQYDALQATIRAGPVVHSDETSWWVNGPGWLWVAATPETTLYVVALSRARAVIEEVLGPTFAGVVVSDCLAVYDGLPGPQQKCYAHHLKAVHVAAADGPSPYLHEWRCLLRAAMALATLDPIARAPARAALDAWVDRLLATPPVDPAGRTVWNRLTKQRDHLFTFLDYPHVDATNNLAERQLRPAVIARKLSCGNKTVAGARAWETLASLAATCTQRRESFIDLVAQSVILHPAR
jgi:transposase